MCDQLIPFIKNKENIKLEELSRFLSQLISKLKINFTHPPTKLKLYEAFYMYDISNIKMMLNPNVSHRVHLVLSQKQQQHLQHTSVKSEVKKEKKSSSSSNNRRSKKGDYEEDNNVSVESTAAAAAAAAAAVCWFKDSPFIFNCFAANYGGKVNLPEIWRQFLLFHNNAQSKSQSSSIIEKKKDFMARFIWSILEFQLIGIIKEGRQQDCAVLLT
eukprot:TRINITY_DN398_c5_g1_i1.p1 TRINITY_DN398_c5_g1~~TRINITY_DN398_c5_g1_i1.p1  ORF type:complete len:215 (-),score=50.04 TRINITY_DN398_c5_g1_i1:28-672(-)